MLSKNSSRPAKFENQYLILEYISDLLYSKPGELGEALTMIESADLTRASSVFDYVVISF